MIGRTQLEVTIRVYESGQQNSHQSFGILALAHI